MMKQLRSLIGVALLLTAVSAFAQTTHAIRVKVPFPFVTAGKSWPAGDYRVQIRTENSTVTLNSSGMASATVLTNTDDRSGVRRTYLRFQRYADHWVLQEVTLDGTAQVLTSVELESELAKLKPSCQETLVASCSGAH
jgi:hypothetical protein